MSSKDPLDSMPLGLGMALAQNPTAMQCFYGLSPQTQQKIIRGTHEILSPSQMRRYVQDIAEGKFSQR